MQPLREIVMEIMDEKYTERAKALLLGRTIAEVRYMTNDEADIWGWSKRGLLLILDDGTVLYPSSDDEGNESGCFYGQHPMEEFFALPTLRHSEEEFNA